MKRRLYKGDHPSIELSINLTSDHEISNLNTSQEDFMRKKIRQMMFSKMRNLSK